MKRITAVRAAVAHLVGPGQLQVVNGQLSFRRRGEPGLRLDPTALTRVDCYGEVSVSGAAMEVLFRHGIPTAWFSPAGARCRGRLCTADPASTGTRVRQLRVFADPAHRREWAKAVVAGKIAAMAAATRRYQRNGTPVGGLLSDFDRLADRTASAADADEVRGVEGAASAAWFRFLSGLLRPPWVFPARTRRPPADPVNALLSLGYTWLTNRATAQLEGRGYEVYVGGLHEYRPGRPSLACDLIEPMRVPAVDRWVLGVCNQGELSPADFQAEEGGGCRLVPAAFGRAMYLYETAWQEAGASDMLGQWVDALTVFIRDRVRESPTEGADEIDP